MASQNNINLFVYSQTRGTKDAIYDMNLTIPDEYINCSSRQGLRINLTAFSMINSMFNCNYTNCKFSIVITNLSDTVLNTYDYEIPYDNYNVNTFRDYINTTYGAYMRMTYNTSKNNYSILRTLVDVTKKVKLVMKTAGDFFGITNGTTYTLSNSVSYNTSFVNMTGWNKLVMNVKGVQYEDATIDNFAINTSTFKESEILFWITRIDKAPFSNLVYACEDNGDCFNYKIFNKHVRSLQITFTDEFENVVYDVPDYTAIIQFEKYDRDNDEMIVSLNTISGFLKQINIYFLIVLEWLKII